MTSLRLLAGSVLALFLVAAPAAVAQTITEWSAEHRVLLSFRVNEGVNLTAVVSTVTRSSTAQGEEGGRADERWQFAAASGERIELQVAYRRALAVKSHAESKLRSALHPELTRTYEVDQAADVVRSASTPDRVESSTFRASGTAFAPLFDGQETLLSVTSLPWFVREVSVP